MPMHKLTRSFVKNVTRDGWYGDGGNLWLQVRGNSKCWLARSKKGGPERQMGLGSIHDVDLDEAREKAREFRRLLRDGKDPWVERDGVRLDQKIKAGRVNTFGQKVDEYIEKHVAYQSSSWKKHFLSLKRNHLDEYADWPIQKFTANIIAGILEKEEFWTKKHRAAEGLLSHLKLIFERAIASEDFHGDNPAAWARLKHILPKHEHIVTNHASLPYQDIPRFMAHLRAWEDTSRRQQGHTAMALLIEFIVLSGVRTREARLMMWSEIDPNMRTWTVPWQHLKEGKFHKRDRPIPITPPMRKVLEEMLRRPVDHSPNALVFPGSNGRPHGETSCPQFVRSTLKWTTPKIDLHGFRSTLRDWCRAKWARPNYNDLWKLQVDHTLGKDKSDGAYGHDKLLEERRVMMTAWGEYLDRPTPADGTNVAQFNEARKRRAS
jgi:integrase